MKISKIGYIKFNKYIFEVQILDNIIQPYEIIDPNTASYQTGYFKIISITDITNNSPVSYVSEYLSNSYHLLSFQSMRIANGKYEIGKKYKLKNKDYYYYYKSKDNAYNENFMVDKQYLLFQDKIRGVYKDYHRNGRLHEEYYHVNGEIVGEYKSYHENGQLHIGCNYIDGLKHGELVSYNNKGIIKQSTMYNNGKMHGKHKLYDDDGNLMYENIYENDIRL
jgi:antitoxin component YwqK of YwqJK toxin-antitoxin module